MLLSITKEDQDTLRLSGKARLSGKDEYGDMVEAISLGYHSGDVQPFTVDMTDLEYINSSGMSAIWTWLQEISRSDATREIRFLVSRRGGWGNSFRKHTLFVCPNQATVEII